MARKEITTGTTKKFLQDINENFEEVYTLINNINNISFGTNPPDITEGEEGDIYIQYDEEV